MTSSYYITTPIYYVNGLPHVGSALTTVSCDVLARFHRMCGDSTWLLTGTDENATKVYEAAEKAGVPPHQFVEQLSNSFKSSWNGLHIGYDDFIRTSEPRHVRACQQFFTRLLERGYVYLDSYEGWYSVSDETFFLDDKVKDGFAIESGKPVIRVQEQNYYFRLSAFSDKLLAYYETHPTFLMPEFRRNEAVAFIHEGLRDMCITRANKGWGIEVPGDPSRVIYVWFDALINYLTATGWPDDESWSNRWPPDLHLMGKEIFVRFHATLWPAMLMALELPLPKQVFAHGWWTARGGMGKLGKSTGGLPTPEAFTSMLMERAGISKDVAADAQRYILCREMNFGLDTDFNLENCLQRYNTDLANDLGNLLNRTLSMVIRYLKGETPDGCGGDSQISALAEQVTEEYGQALAVVRLNSALESLWKLVTRMNKYIDEKAPWVLAKRSALGESCAITELNCVLYSCLEATRICTVLLTPFMPCAAAAMRLQLGLTEPPGWDETRWGLLDPGTIVGPPMPVFPRIQDLTLDEVELLRLGAVVMDNIPLAEEKQTNMEPLPSDHPDAGTAPRPGDLIVPPEENATPDPIISIDDFAKIQLRVGDILAAEPVPNATKLLRLTVQVGDGDTRTILAGIAEFYDPAELVGRQVVLVANLLPRKMRGIESQGMLLAADVDGRAILLQPDSVVPSGSRVR
jgi:methionyl-tRNA synthetase